MYAHAWSVYSPTQPHLPFRILFLRSIVLSNRCSMQLLNFLQQPPWQCDFPNWYLLWYSSAISNRNNFSKKTPKALHKSFKLSFVPADYCNLIFHMVYFSLFCFQRALPVWNGCSITQYQAVETLSFEIPLWKLPFPKGHRYEESMPFIASIKILKDSIFSYISKVIWCVNIQFANSD